MSDNKVRSHPLHAHLPDEQVVYGKGANHADDSCRARVHAIIRRVHGEVGSPLAAVGLRLELIKGKPELNDDVRHVLEEISGDLGLVIESVRGSMTDLKEVVSESRNNSEVKADN